MSLVFSATSSPYNGIIQGIETTLYGADGLTRISGNATQLGLWTTRVNRSMDRAFAIIFASDGRWQFDDTNHTDYPIITTDLVANQRDYTFTSDENGNLILEIDKVLIADANNGPYREMTPKDAQKDSDTAGFWDGNDTTGGPTSYDKTANAVFLDPVPSGDVTNGLKVYISREGSYFTTSDTTKKPGFAGLFHDYLVLRPAFEFALENGHSNASGLQVLVNEKEAHMREFYARRNQDEAKRLTVGYQNNR